MTRTTGWILTVFLAIAAPALAVTDDRPALSVASSTASRAVTVPQDYIIGPDDVLQVVYWRDQDLSAEVVVRPDGQISLPLLRDVPAMGLTPDALAQRVQTLASAYLQTPNVTVVVKQINSRKVFITGEVGKPGVYMLSGPTTVLQLIALAGGITPYAKQDRIVIMRQATGGSQTFRFSYKKASQLRDLQQNILLLPGDTVVVP